MSSQEEKHEALRKLAKVADIEKTPPFHVLSLTRYILRKVIKYDQLDFKQTTNVAVRNKLVIIIANAGGNMLTKNVSRLP